MKSDLSGSRHLFVKKCPTHYQPRNKTKEPHYHKQESRRKLPTSYRSLQVAVQVRYGAMDRDKTPSKGLKLASAEETCQSVPQVIWIGRYTLYSSKDTSFLTVRTLLYITVCIKRNGLAQRTTLFPMTPDLSKNAELYSALL